MVEIKVGGLIHEQIVVAVLVTAAEIDDIVVIGIRDNATDLRVLRQLLIASFGIVHQSQDLATISLNLVLVNARNGRELRKICVVVSLNLPLIRLRNPLLGNEMAISRKI